MDIDDAHALAEGLLHEHGLTAWRLVFDRARTRAGICRYGRREIGLSAILTGLHPPELVRGTILHEIAHALVGPQHGHDAAWRAAARAIGSDGERCLSPDAPRAAAPWVGSCQRGHEVTRHRRPITPASCRRCARGFDPAHLIVWTFRGRRMPLSPAEVAELAALTRGTDPAAVGARRASARARLLDVGAAVVLEGAARGPYAGLTGFIVKRGRTRYHVRTARGLVTAPFELVRPAPA